ncbi:Interferon- developmental regulator 1 [Coemansia guatemalensis]|uniref:Interferon- developmental regulator 1 n=1 Tax=Coemansia guatemalensis TaxID=2761395 RepID=A0A9W8HN87_9FUNG|nr:Interferon- developmental regulator 1 [Coemansia guatemalensis]
MARKSRESNELLRTALNSGRTRSSTGRSGRATPKSQSQRSSRAGSGIASRDESEDEDDVASNASDDTWALSEADDAGAEVSGNWEAQLEEALDGVGEKRVATREKALTTVERLMAHVYMGDALEGRRVTLLEALRRGARSTKSDRERVLALRCVALWFVSFGAEEEGEEELPQTAELLHALAADADAVSSDVRAAALAALGMANFIAAADYRDAAELLRAVWYLLDAALDAREAVLARQAFETAGLLLTVVLDSNLALAEQLFDNAFSAHMRALTADAVDVRVAAAQNFALMHDALASERSSSTETPVFGARNDELIGVLEMLRHEPAKRHARRATATQRAAMRDVLGTIEHSQPPELRLAVHGRTIRFGDWTRILRLQAFRAALRGGLPLHFVQNPLLHDVFEVEFDVGSEEYLRNGARIVVGPSSELAKARSVEIRKRRDAHRTAQRYGSDSE